MAPRFSDEELLDVLTRLFRAHGYAGTTLSRISRATGLGRASLYHRFPNGKAEMAEKVVRRSELVMYYYVLEPLDSDCGAAERLNSMGRRLVELYRGGRESCLLEAMSLNEPESLIADRVRAIMVAWVQSVRATLSDAGIPPSLAAERAEQLVIRIQGSLIAARILGDPGPFGRTIESLTDQALARGPMTSEIALR